MIIWQLYVCNRLCCECDNPQDRADYLLIYQIYLLG